MPGKKQKASLSLLILDHLYLTQNADQKDRTQIVLGWNCNQRFQRRNGQRASLTFHIYTFSRKHSLLDLCMCYCALCLDETHAHTFTHPTWNRCMWMYLCFNQGVIHGWSLEDPRPISSTPSFSSSLFFIDNYTLLVEGEVWSPGGVRPPQLPRMLLFLPPLPYKHIFAHKHREQCIAGQSFTLPWGGVIRPWPYGPQAGSELTIS